MLTITTLEEENILLDTLPIIQAKKNPSHRRQPSIRLNQNDSLKKKEIDSWNSILDSITKLTGTESRDDTTLKFNFVIPTTIVEESYKIPIKEENKNDIIKKGILPPRIDTGPKCTSNNASFELKSYNKQVTEEQLSEKSNGLLPNVNRLTSNSQVKLTTVDTYTLDYKWPIDKKYIYKFSKSIYKNSQKNLTRQGSKENKKGDNKSQIHGKNGKTYRRRRIINADGEYLDDLYFNECDSKWIHEYESKGPSLDHDGAFVRIPRRNLNFTISSLGKRKRPINPFKTLYDAPPGLLSIWVLKDILARNIEDTTPTRPTLGKIHTSQINIKVIMGRGVLKNGIRHKQFQQLHDLKKKRSLIDRNESFLTFYSKRKDRKKGLKANKVEVNNADDDSNTNIFERLLPECFMYYYMYNTSQSHTFPLEISTEDKNYFYEDYFFCDLETFVERKDSFEHYMYYKYSGFDTDDRVRSKTITEYGNDSGIGFNTVESYNMNKKQVNPKIVLNTAKIHKDAFWDMKANKKVKKRNLEQNNNVLRNENFLVTHNSPTKKRTLRHWIRKTLLRRTTRVEEKSSLTQQVINEVIEQPIIIELVDNRKSLESIRHDSVRRNRNKFDNPNNYNIRNKFDYNGFLKEDSYKNYQSPTVAMTSPTSAHKLFNKSGENEGVNHIYKLMNRIEYQNVLLKEYSQISQNHNNHNNNNKDLRNVFNHWEDYKSNKKLYNNGMPSIMEESDINDHKSLLSLNQANHGSNIVEGNETKIYLTELGESNYGSKPAIQDANADGLANVTQERIVEWLLAISSSEQDQPS